MKRFLLAGTILFGGLALLSGQNGSKVASFATL